MRTRMTYSAKPGRSRSAGLCMWALPLAFGAALSPAPATAGPPGPPPVVDVTRSVGINDLPVLESLAPNGTPRFSLQRVLTQIAATAEVWPPLSAADVYQRIFDTNNTAAQGLVQGGQHCDDQKDQNGNPVINGFPIECPRQEGILADLTQNNPFCSGTGCAPYSPIAITNRFDLAPPDGENCGQYRIVFGKGTGGVTPLSSLGNTKGTDRNLLIFEAILPNPNPGCGIAACAPVVEFWTNLTNQDDPAQRAAALDQFFFQGIGGFEPAVKWSHYTGQVNPITGVQQSGQIRANQFMKGNTQLLPGAAAAISGQSWQLREYNLSTTCDNRFPGWFAANPCGGKVQLVSVKINPSASLFADLSTITDPNLLRLATSFQSSQNPAGFLAQIPSLSATDTNLIAMGKLDPVFNGGQSTEQPDATFTAIPLGDTNYLGAFNPSGTFASAIQSALTSQGSPFTPTDIVKRAQTQACAGCHDISTTHDTFGFPTADQLDGTCTNDPTTGACVWPDTNIFTQTSEKVLAQLPLPPPPVVTTTCTAACTASPTTCQCAWPLSPALVNVFMPFRAQNMITFLQNNGGIGSGRCGSSCEQITLTYGDHTH